MKRPSTKLRELRLTLRYWQMQARIDARCLRSSRNKCKAIGAMMRKIVAKVTL